MIAFALALLFAGQDSEVFGIGNDSCATAMQMSKDKERRVYILGFWTGMNAANAKRVGHTSDAMGIIGEVERYCQRDSSQPLGQAAFSTYKKLESERR